MLAPDSEIPSSPGTEAAPQPDFRVRWWFRIVLFVLHLAIVVAAISLTPPGYSFQLGESTGSILLFGSIPLWWLLFAAKERPLIFLFCILAVAQAGFVALVALHFRAEDRVLRPIMEEFSTRRYRWAYEMQQFRMDPLLEMTSGRRPLSIAELRELQMRARAAKARWTEMQSEALREVADAESRIAAVSSGAARDFRRGFESTRPVWEEQKEYFTEVEELTGFLIDRQGQYSQTSQGLEFKRDGDAQSFNKRLDAIARLQEQLNVAGHGLKPQ
jgi:hypothetical protein